MGRETDRDRILHVLGEEDGPVCDDCLVEPADLSARQRAYQVCSNLAQQGKVNRAEKPCKICGKRKNTTWPGDGQAVDIETDALVEEEQASGAPGEHPWYWEGNVQSKLVAWLSAKGYQIRRVAHTETRQSGKDVVAVNPQGEKVWIEVKGYPESSPHTQARHWFSGALFTLTLDREENPDVKLAAAFPAGFTTYENLAERVTWLRESMPFTIYWVERGGKVREAS